MFHLEFQKKFKMEEHIARKEVLKKPRFRLSTEVRATLERKYDRWRPVRAYNRVSKELTMLISLCKIILGFFKKFLRMRKTRM